MTSGQIVGKMDTQKKLNVPLDSMESMSRVEGFPQKLVRVAPNSISEENMGNLFAECGAHAECSMSFAPYSCGMEPKRDSHFELEKTNKCEPYRAPQMMYCSNTCLTGGCGDNPIHFYGERFEVQKHRIFKDYSVGWCQPCNTCLYMPGANNFENKAYTMDGNDCPGLCRLGLAAPFAKPTLNETLAVGPLTPYLDPNAYGGFTLDMWVKDFYFQNLMQKYIKVPGSWPNHRWQGYENRQMRVANVDTNIVVPE